MDREWRDWLKGERSKNRVENEGNVNKYEEWVRNRKKFWNGWEENSDRRNENWRKMKNIEI